MPVPARGESRRGLPPCPHGGSPEARQSRGERPGRDACTPCPACMRNRPAALSGCPSSPAPSPSERCLSRGRWRLTQAPRLLAMPSDEMLMKPAGRRRRFITPCAAMAKRSLLSGLRNPSALACEGASPSVKARPGQPDERKGAQHAAGRPRPGACLPPAVPGSQHRRVDACGRDPIAARHAAARSGAIRPDPSGRPEAKRGTRGGWRGGVGEGAGCRASPRGTARPGTGSARIARGRPCPPPA